MRLPGTTWTAEAATYGTGTLIDQPVTMSDATVLRVNVYYPTDPSGAAAAGPFPVLLTHTVYGKGTSVGGPGGPDSYLVDPVQATDGVRLFNYAAGLPHSTGQVGLYGPSYSGINQLLTAPVRSRRTPRSRRSSPRSRPPTSTATRPSWAA